MIRVDQVQVLSLKTVIIVDTGMVASQKDNCDTSTLDYRRNMYNKVYKVERCDNSILINLHS